MLPTFQSWTVRKMIECLTQGLLSSHWNIYHDTTAYFFEPPCRCTVVNVRLTCVLNKEIYIKKLHVTCMECECKMWKEDFDWNCSLIYGFISKEEARRKLIGRECGTFLLRFSETNIEQSQKSDICGCLTLAFVELDPTTGLLVFHWWLETSCFCVAPKYSHPL